jgi:hypothetical protein
MGLDMYAYVATRAGQNEDYWEQAHILENLNENFLSPVTKPRELAYWRKHPNLHGWMEDLWRSKHDLYDVDDQMFNGVELELTWDDLNRLEQDIKSGNLPSTSGFFFGDDSDEYYHSQDLQFVADAKAEVFLGLKVFYNSSW